MSVKKGKSFSNMFYRMKINQKVPKWMKKRGKERVTALMSLPENKLRNLLSLEENSFEQRELFEVATVHLDFNSQRRVQERRKLTDATLRRIRLQSSTLSHSKYQSTTARSVVAGKTKEKRKISMWRPFKKRKCDAETERMLEALGDLRRRVQEYELNLRNEVKRWKRIWETIKTEEAKSQPLWEKTAETLIRWGRQAFLDTLEKRETTRRIWRQQMQLMSHVAGQILTERLFAVRPVYATLDIQEKALSTLSTSPDAPSRRKQSADRRAGPLGSEKYVTTELSDKDVQHQLWPASEDNSQKSRDSYRPPVPARRKTAEDQKARKRHSFPSRGEANDGSVTAPSGDKDLGGGDRTVDEMTCIANTSVSGASVVAGDGARADTLHSCKPDIVEPGSGASPPSPTNVLLPQSAGVSKPESTSEGAVEGAGITTAQVCACAPSQSSEGDSVPSSDKTGEKKAPVDNGDNGEQSSGNVPTNLWKRMKEAGLIQDREWMFNTFDDCFVGREATQFLVREGICSTRSMAVKLMAALVEEKKISHVMFERLPFKDGHFFYHWLEYRAEVNGKLVVMRATSPSSAAPNSPTSFSNALSDPVLWSPPPPRRRVSAHMKQATAEKMLASGIITNLDFEQLAQEVNQDLENSATAHRKSKKVNITQPKKVDKYANVVCIENVQSIREACRLLNAAEKLLSKAATGHANEGVVSIATRGNPLNAIDTAVVFSKRVSRYFQCKKQKGIWRPSTTFHPSQDVVLLQRATLSPAGMTYCMKGGLQHGGSEKKDLPVGDAFFVSPKQLLARDAEYDAARHFTEDLERRLEAIDAEVAEFSSVLNMFTNRKQRLLALLARYRILRHRENKHSRQDLEDNPHEGFDTPAAAVRQHARSFFEVEELLPDELVLAHQSVWSSWCTGLAKQLQTDVATDEVQQKLDSVTNYEKEHKLLREQFGALIFDDRTAQGALFRRWLETLTDVTMAVIPAFIKFFTKVLSFDFDLGVAPTLALEESEATGKGDKIADQFPQLASKSFDNSSLLKAGSRVSMGMWLGRRASSTSESSVLRAARRWASPNRKSAEDMSADPAQLGVLSEHGELEEEVFIHECTAIKAASPLSELESGSDNSNVYESMLSPRDDDADKKKMHVKGIVDLLEMLTASAIYAHPLVEALCFRCADVSESAAERDLRWRNQLSWVRAMPPKAFDIAESFLQVDEGFSNGDVDRESLPQGLVPGCQLAILLPKLRRQLEPFESSHLPTEKVQALLKTTALIAVEAARLNEKAKQRHRKQQPTSGSAADHKPSKRVSLGSGADVILPVLVYAAVHSGMQHPYRCVAIAQTLGTDADKGEAAYYLCSLEVALTYVTNLQQFPLVDLDDRPFAVSSCDSARSSESTSSDAEAEPFSVASADAGRSHSQHNTQLSLKQVELSTSVEKALSAHVRRSVRTTNLQKGWIKNLQSDVPKAAVGGKSALQEFQKRQNDGTLDSTPQLSNATSVPISSVFEDDYFREDVSGEDCTQQDLVGETEKEARAGSAGVLGKLKCLDRRKAQVKSAGSVQEVVDDKLGSWFDEHLIDDSM